MKIGIITCFDAVNYGSFLQAFCLQEALKDLGANEVKMIKTTSLLYEKWRYTSLFTYKPSKIKFKLKLAKGYYRIWNLFDITKDKTGYDLVIVGSDEMWNLKNITMKALPIFWGANIQARRLITYAVSCNNTTSEDVVKCKFVVNGLTKFDKISVRDISTQKAFAPYVSGDIRFDVDPTLLINLNKYVIPTKEKNYILVYTYGFEQYMIDGVKKLAKDLNKEIIIVGQNFNWGDKRIPADAFEFLGLIKSADLIVTDTFHGTVLSLGLKKQVLSYANHKPKVFRILEQFDILYRNVSNKKDLSEAYQNYIDYKKIDVKIEELRKNSLNYLKDEIRKVGV